ncbi:hypothetical protein [Maritimibacter sp. UBA3975]|uniref:hypothetical protein n=1 Tax=Maritimibacter sp. UBA3975 TaxID=1946833 RepID=UPI000C0A7C38|nr:hypothetical protein [Maritimibacter sp. UBA3975]MAM63705.1 hypothetical protein [Maritimibacter sp.]|tara:strand:- start:14880 stop:15818 length:939 start_codon:yes stop_codon:yes gene_type:complete
MSRRLQDLVRLNARDRRGIAPVEGTVAASPASFAAHQPADLRAETEATLSALPAGLADRVLARFDPGRVIPGSYEQERDILFFINVPMTAGGAVVGALKDVFDRTRSFGSGALKGDLKAEWQAALDAREAAGGRLRQALAGPFRFKRLSEMVTGASEVQFASFIRNPADRLFSDYVAQSSPDNPDHAAFLEEFPTFEAYVDGAPENPQLAQLVGMTGNVSEMLERLVSTYSFVGVSEHVSASVEHFRRSHNLPTLSDISEAAMDQAARLSPALRSRICKRHMGDWVLFTLLEPAMAGFEQRLAAVAYPDRLS